MTIRIADHWFERKQVDEEITLLWEPMVDPLLRCNIWHVRGRDRDLLVDTGLGICSLREAARDLLQKNVIAFATHSHMDHMGGMHEFNVRIGHPKEQHAMTHPVVFGSMSARDYDPSFVQYMADIGYPLKEELITAYPYEGYDPSRYTVQPAAPTWLVEEGDVVDLGNRSFEVLHLPGHSPGSIGLWEKSTGILFSGDAVYDGPLLDGLEDSSIVDYVHTMERLKSLPVQVVHAGHDPSFNRRRLLEIVESYLESRSG